MGGYFRSERPGKARPASEMRTQQPSPPVSIPPSSEKAASSILSRTNSTSRTSSTLNDRTSRASLAPSMRSSKSTFIDDIKHEVMVNYLYQQQCSHMWVSDGCGDGEGVLLRKTRNHYLACPPELASSAFALACAELNVHVAMTVNSRVIKTFLAWSPDAIDVPLMNGLRVQILPTLDDLPRARKYQFAAFIASEALLVVWDDDPSHIVKRAASIEAELMQLVWQTGEENVEEEESGNEKKPPRVTEYEIDQESGEIIPEARSTNLLNTVLVAFTLIIVTTMLGAGARSLAIETAVDKSYLRMLFLLLAPVQIFFTLVRKFR